MRDYGCDVGPTKKIFNCFADANHDLESPTTPYPSYPDQ